nr:hypothetical protein CFP56_50434 [Quercus suber]
MRRCDVIDSPSPPYRSHLQDGFIGVAPRNKHCQIRASIAVASTGSLGVKIQKEIWGSTWEKNRMRSIGELAAGRPSWWRRKCLPQGSESPFQWDAMSAQHAQDQHDRHPSTARRSDIFNNQAGIKARAREDQLRH